jgi:hypothetical protein
VRGKPNIHRGTRSSLPVGKPLERIAIDLMEFPKTHDGYQYACTMMDECTLFTMAVPLKDKFAITVWEAFEYRWVAVFGKPHGVLSCL